MSRDRKCSPQTLRVLAALLARSGLWRHGYDLSKDTGLKAGTLYPILMRLSGRGLLDSRWEDSPQPGRPPRHAYHLSAQGRVFAATRLGAEPAASPAGAPLTQPA